MINVVLVINRLSIYTYNKTKDDTLYSEGFFFRFRFEKEIKRRKNTKKMSVIFYKDIHNKRDL